MYGYTAPTATAAGHVRTLRTDHGPLAPAPSRRAAATAVLLPAAVMLGLGLWGLDRGAMWRDEGATFQLARRSLPELWHALGHVDAVHGLYYLLMHCVLDVLDVLAVLPFRADEVALRLPSVLAAACTAGLVAAIGCRLARPRVGLWAGLLYAVTPFAGHYAQEGRSYALVAAGAALAAWLLIRAVGAPAGSGARSGGSGSGSGAWGVGSSPASGTAVGRWAAYGAVCAVTFCLHEFAVLLLAAHATTLLLCRAPARTWRGWGCASAAAVAVLAPLALLSRRQSGQIAWIGTPRAADAEALLREFAGPSSLVLTVNLLLVAVALARFRVRPGRLDLTALALPLALVPPALLFAAAQWQPVFLDRYLLHSLAGLPLLVAVGAERLVRGLQWRRTVTAAGVAAIAVSLWWQLPIQQRERLPTSRADDLKAVASAFARVAKPGDTALFFPSYERRVALAYPRDFAGVRDATLLRSGAEAGTLYGTDAGPAELRTRLTGLDRVWVVSGPGGVGEDDRTAVLDSLFRRESVVYVRGGSVALYVRR
ncbi:glycosyltransferase family 39 protein [Streptomyces sp. NPDC050610]|uniref:glycosyltransferase family 39 protein n=1 Tax=Streptomyces sp. NPDC050610 TaxID=3157097 RepID=UPI00341A9CEE